MEFAEFISQIPAAIPEEWKLDLIRRHLVEQGRVQSVTSRVPDLRLVLNSRRSRLRFGDWLAWIIKRVTFGRVKPCTGCRTRAAAMNRWGWRIETSFRTWIAARRRSLYDAIDAVRSHDVGV